MQFRVAFHIMGGDNWTVGQIYLKNLFHALREAYEGEIVLSLLAPAGQQGVEDYARSLKADELILYHLPQRWSVPWVVNKLRERLLSCDKLVENVLKKYKIDIIFGPVLVYKYHRIATLAWLPDFQHTHLPEMFSETERVSRDQTFLRCAQAATRVILMSEAVRKDFESFAPLYVHKVRVLHPVSYIPQSIYEENLNSILNLYHLPEKFVYLPNQFWKHKNYEVVFQAIKVLKERGVKVLVVCTGSPLDYRHPTYFADLFQKLSQLDIREQVIYLGLISREHVLLLMRQSICVLNPSLFEGWGHTVDEARSVGKQVLVSDIPAHREQNLPKATFFNPYDCEDLVEKLGQIWREVGPGPDTELEVEARHSLPERLRAYAEAFVSVVREAVEEVKG